MQEFCEKYKDTAVGTQLDDVISVAGRIYAMRASGAKLVFYDLRAEGAKIQIMANMAAYKVRSNWYFNSDPFMVSFFATFQNHIFYSRRRIKVNDFSLVFEVFFDRMKVRERICRYHCPNPTR